MNRCMTFLTSLLFATSTVFAGEVNLPEVGVLTLKAGRVELTTQLNGRAAAKATAEIRPQVTGIIQERLFEEGSDVKKGDQLYQIDPAMFEAQLNSARAVLEQAVAKANVAEAKRIRYDELLKQKAVSKQEWDEVNAQDIEAQAQIGIAEAQVAIAVINLDYTKVLAPLDGRIGRSNVTQGALVSANQPEPLAIIQRLDPIYVDVSQSTAGMLKLQRAFDSGVIQEPASTGATVRLIMEDGQPYAHEGKILFVDVAVDRNTGSVSMRAEFPNPDWEILPDMYVKAIIKAGAKSDAISVPQLALLRDQDGSAYVYVVADDGAVEKRPVEIISALKNQWLLKAGVKDGERIVVEGTQRIRLSQDGSPFKVKFTEVNAEDYAAPRGR